MLVEMPRKQRLTDTATGGSFALDPRRERRAARWKGPSVLFAAWVIHDLEEAVAFPATCGRLADRTGIARLKITPQQSWIAVGLMGLLVAAACGRGISSHGRSPLYRAVVAALEAHVATHLGASVALGGYTAGVATAMPIMFPGARMARRELPRNGSPLLLRDTIGGALLLLPAALACQIIARGIHRIPGSTMTAN